MHIRMRELRMEPVELKGVAHPSGSLMKSTSSFPLVSGASATMFLTRLTQLATKALLSMMLSSGPPFRYWWSSTT